MKSHIAASLFAAAASFVHALPAPVPQAASVMPAGPPGSSGSLRGTPALLGYDPANPLSTDTTVIPTSEFELAPGQSANANLGLFLDLSEVENPQPIRGDTQGPTDPGPRTYTDLPHVKCLPDSFMDKSPGSLLFADVPKEPTPTTD